jgi:hypothetical protein
VPVPQKFDMSDTTPIQGQGEGGPPAKFDMTDAVPIAPPTAPKQVGPLDSLAQWGEDKFHTITPKEMQDKFHQFDAVREHPGITRAGVNTVNAGIRTLTSLPASIAGWFDGPWTPAGSSQAIADRAQGRTPIDPKKPLPNIDAEHASDLATNTVGGAAAGYLAGEVGAGALKGVGKVLSIPKKILRNTAESATQTGPRNVASIVRNVAKDNEAAVAAAKTADEKAARGHLEATQDALHETQGRELSHQQAIEKARTDAREAQTKLDKDHEATVQKALDDTRQAEDLHKGELQKAKLESEEAYQKKLAEVSEQRAKAERARRAELREYMEKREKVVAQRAEAEQKFKSAQAAQKKIAPTEDKLKTEYRNLQAKVETAREKARKIGNEKYNGVNEALNDEQASRRFLETSLSDAAESIKGSNTETPIMKDMEKRTKGEAGTDPITYRDLQGYYTELGNELTKGTLPADVYQTYNKLHESIGGEMQRIADEKGMGAQLTDAQNYWRRMKQTFGKPLAVKDAATKALGKSTSGIAANEALENQIRLLGSFDPEIPKQFGRVANVEKGVEALPKAASAADLVDKAKPPAIPPRYPALPKVNVPEPPPVAPREVAAPARVPIPDRPGSVEPAAVPPPERVAPPDRPPVTKADTKTLTPEMLSEMKLKGADTAAEKMRSPNRLASTFLGYDLLRNAFDTVAHIAHGDPASALGSVSKAMRDVAIRYTYGATSSAFADVLENDSKVRVKLGQITPRDIEHLKRLPPDQQKVLADSFQKLFEAADQKKVSVSAPLRRWAMGVGGAKEGGERKGVAAALAPVQ